MSGTFSEGDIIGGKYRLENHLGGGGFGSVFEGRDTDTGQTVAIKTPDYSGRNPEKTIDKYFIREKEALEKVNDRGGHQNIMGFKESVTEGGAPCLVLEKVDGKEFGEYLNEKSTMDTDTARKFGIQLCDAVAFLHEEVEVMYRDLKPDNVMMRGNKPVLIDFTTVKEYEQEVAESIKGSSSSRKGSLFGDSAGGYKPAELTGEADVPQGPWTDVYSIGRMILFATVKLAPSNSKYELEPSKFNPDLNNYLDKIVVKATHKDPAKRYGSAHSLKRALENKDPNPPKEARLERVSSSEEHRIQPGDTIGRHSEVLENKNDPPTTIEIESEYVSGVHCRFELDSRDDWVLRDRSLNGTYINKADDPGTEWHCIISSNGVERLKNNGRESRADKAEGEAIKLDVGDTIALLDPGVEKEKFSHPDSWYRFTK